MSVFVEVVIDFQPDGEVGNLLSCRKGDIVRITERDQFWWGSHSE